MDFLFIFAAFVVLPGIVFILLLEYRKWRERKIRLEKAREEQLTEKLEKFSTAEPSEKVEILGRIRGLKLSVEDVETLSPLKSGSEESVRVEDGQADSGVAASARIRSLELSEGCVILRARSPRVVSQDLIRSANSMSVK